MVDIALGIIIASFLIKVGSEAWEAALRLLANKYIPEEYQTFHGSPYSVYDFYERLKDVKETEAFIKHIPKNLVYKDVELVNLDEDVWELKVKGVLYNVCTKHDLYNMYTTKRVTNKEMRMFKEAVNECKKQNQYNTDMKDIAEGNN
jgi:hypothetical protein